MKLNERLIEDFSKEIEDGLPVQYTCDLLGIHQTSYNNWMRMGEDDLLLDNMTLYAQFFLAIKKAYAIFVKDAKARIRAGEKGWQGTCWWLERTNNFFMPKQQIQADDEGKVNVIIGGKPKDAIKRQNKGDS